MRLFTLLPRLTRRGFPGGKFFRFALRLLSPLLSWEDQDLQHLELEGLHSSFIPSGGGGAKTRKLESDRKMPHEKDIYGFTHLDAEGKAVYRFTKQLIGRFEVG